MKDHRVSEVYCLMSQTEVQLDRQFLKELYSVKGTVNCRLRRRQFPGYTGSEAFPPGCMGNDQKDVEVIDTSKDYHRLSYDEQVSVMNILSKIRKYRIEVTSRHRNKPNKVRLIVGHHLPTVEDLEYMVQAIAVYNRERQNIYEQNTPDPSLGGGTIKEIMTSVLTELEMNFVTRILLNSNAYEVFKSQLRCSMPSRIYRNPITGSGVEEKRRMGKRGFENVLKFIESH